MPTTVEYKPCEGCDDGCEACMKMLEEDVFENLRTELTLGEWHLNFWLFVEGLEYGLGVHPFEGLPQKREWDKGCDGTHRLTTRLLKMIPGIDVEGSIKNFKHHGGRCDCEVLTNAVHSIMETVKRREAIFAAKAAMEKGGPMPGIMTPKHPGWALFLSKLAGKECEGDEAESPTVHEKVLVEHFPDVDVEGSVVFFEANGGFCTCEIGMNIDGKDPEHLNFWQCSDCSYAEMEGEDPPEKCSACDTLREAGDGAPEPPFCSVHPTTRDHPPAGGCVKCWAERVDKFQKEKKAKSTEQKS